MVSPIRIDDIIDLATDLVSSPFRICDIALIQIIGYITYKITIKTKWVPYNDLPSLTMNMILIETRFS